MPWSTKKLDTFYTTPLGKSVKDVVQKQVHKIIEKCTQKQKLGTQPKVLSFGYDLVGDHAIFTDKCDPLEQQFDLIVACHCEELSINFCDFMHFCDHHLEPSGICILLTSNGNGFWTKSHTPFSKYRSYKNIKALKRTHFKILNKKPLLFFPLSLCNTRFKNTCRIWDSVCRLIAPSFAGAMLVTAQKNTVLSHSPVLTCEISKKARLKIPSLAS